jgi:hypothetical protein
VTEYSAAPPRIDASTPVARRSSAASGSRQARTVANGSAGRVPPLRRPACAGTGRPRPRARRAAAASCRSPARPRVAGQRGDAAQLIVAAYHTGPRPAATKPGPLHRQRSPPVRRPGNVGRCVVSRCRVWPGGGRRHDAGAPPRPADAWRPWSIPTPDSRSASAPRPRRCGVRDRRPRARAAGAGGLAQPPRAGIAGPGGAGLLRPVGGAPHGGALRQAGLRAVGPVAGPPDARDRPGGAASSRRPCGKVDFVAHAWAYTCSRPPRWPRRRPRRPGREGARARSTRIQRLTSVSSAGVVGAGTASCSASSSPGRRCCRAVITAA